MTGTLVVDFGVLNHLNNDLTTVRATLERAHKRIDASAADIGSSTVQNALADFDSRWDDKRTSIEHSADSLGSMLTSSLHAYSETDAHLANAVQVHRTDTRTGGGA